VSAPVIVELSAGRLRLALRPDLGGSVAGLWRDGEPVMRSVAPAQLAGPRQSACFPLVPYSNRLGHRRFRWQGGAYTTQPNFDGDTPHSLHGVGWRRAWIVEHADDRAATLSFVHRADADWPFPFTATQTFRLDGDSLDMTLAMVNDEPDRVAPAGLGWHPYFAKRSGSRIELDVTARWDTDDTGLPTGRTNVPPFSHEVVQLAVDHCHEGWPGVATIHDDHGSLRLTSSLPRVVVYTPPSQPFFCVEPVSHVTDAINADDPASRGLVALAPGAAMTATMRLEIEPHRPLP
jgi:aldose 1-epimerase